MDLPDVTLSLCGGLSENGEISKGRRAASSALGGGALPGTQPWALTEVAGSPSAPHLGASCWGDPACWWVGGLWAWGLVLRWPRVLGGRGQLSPSCLLSCEVAGIIVGLGPGSPQSEHEKRASYCQSCLLSEMVFLAKVEGATLSENWPRRVKLLMRKGVA